MTAEELDAIEAAHKLGGGVHPWDTQRVIGDLLVEVRQARAALEATLTMLQTSLAEQNANCARLNARAQVAEVELRRLRVALDESTGLLHAIQKGAEEALQRPGRVSKSTLEMLAATAQFGWAKAEQIARGEQ